MPICPACHTEQTKRLRGCCPKCNIPVDVYKGRWYRAGIGSPTLGILTHFEERVSQSLSYGRPSKVNFSVPRKSLRYKRELVSAEQMLNEADGDYDLVLSAINILFNDTKFNWKTRDSLMGIRRDFTLALAIAKADVEAEQAKKKKEMEVLTSIFSRENVFNN
jgi:hypothetical protein